MAGGFPAGGETRTTGGKARWGTAGVVALLVFAVLIVLREARFPFTELLPVIPFLPTWLLLIVILGAEAALSMAVLRAGRSEEAIVLVEGEPAPEPGIPTVEELGVEVGPETAHLRTGVAASAPAARHDSDLDSLLRWVNDVGERISSWAGSLGTLSPKAAPRKASQSAVPETLPGSENPPQGSRKILRRKHGPKAWTETMARHAVEDYLRNRPSARVVEIADALHMEFGLADRVVDALKRDGSE